LGQFIQEFIDFGSSFGVLNLQNRLNLYSLNDFYSSGFLIHRKIIDGVGKKTFNGVQTSLGSCGRDFKVQFRDSEGTMLRFNDVSVQILIVNHSVSVLTTIPTSALIQFKTIF